MRAKKGDPISAEILNNRVALDELCWCCEGEGRPMPKNETFALKDGSCEICKGVGYTLTDLGYEIIRLVKRHKYLLGG